MVPRLFPTRRCPSTLLLVGLSVLLSSCGVRKGAPNWIGDDAAVIRCTVSGPNLELPQLFVEVPSVLPPTGLFARAMDPIALDQLGYERDRAVCATLQAPDDAELEQASVAIGELISARNELGKQARKIGRCLCNYADALGSRTLVPSCADKPTERNCELEPEKLASLDALLTPFRAKVETTYVPRVHWRLAGRTDRRGRFVARYEDLLARHPGGSEVYLPNMPLPPHPGMALIAGLLARPEIVAVVRQDSGRGMLVVREIEDELILDHFSYPDWLDVDIRGVDLELSALLLHLDDAQLARYRAALEPPDEPREPMFNPRKGYSVELDRAALERVDRAMLLATSFAGHRYDADEESREMPPLFVERFAHQVPYGTEGTVLRARLGLSEAGRTWFEGFGEGEAVESLGGLGEAELPYEFVSATRDGVLDLFSLRGRPIEESLFSGATALPEILFAIELASPGSVEGSVQDFTVAVPSGPLPGEFHTRKGLGSLRERLSKQAHELEVELVEDGNVLALELTPQ